MESPIHAMRQPPSAATPLRGGARRSDGAADAGAQDWTPDDGVLSDVWSVFQQLMLEVPEEQPVVVLATTHCGRLPPDLLRWFDHPQVCCSRAWWMYQWRIAPSHVYNATTSSHTVRIEHHVHWDSASRPACGLPP